MRYCIVLDTGDIVDLEHFKIVMLEEEQIQYLEENIPRPWRPDGAEYYHELNMDRILKRTLS